MELRERTNNENWNEYLDAMAQPGDIVRVSAGHYVLVITRCRFENSFYYTPCNFDGSLTTKKWEQSAANYINNSVMITICNKKRLEVVNCINLDSHTIFNNCKKYTWFLTGDKAIDAYMSQLDARYQLFVDTCNDEQMHKYKEQEDRNYHSENGYFVGLHAKFMLDDKLKALKAV